MVKHGAKTYLVVHGLLSMSLRLTKIVNQEALNLTSYKICFYYSEISHYRTPLVLQKGVHHRDVSAIGFSIYKGLTIIGDDLVPERGVRYREVSITKHVLFREVPLHLLRVCSPL